jgi:Arc/MetJ family transcription regulator
LETTSIDAKFDALEFIMRTTLNLDGELIEKAMKYTGISEKSALVREALRSLVAIEAGRRLAALGGSDPKAKAAPRRRIWAK